MVTAHYTLSFPFGCGYPQNYTVCTDCVIMHMYQMKQTAQRGAVYFTTKVAFVLV